jgi:hypothetical protein
VSIKTKLGAATWAFGLKNRSQRPKHWQAGIMQNRALEKRKKQ